jgi:hypothetical protein
MRAHHQDIFKEKLIERYKCSHVSNPSVIKCMVLGYFFSKDEVEAGHIISLKQQDSLPAVGLDMKDVWNERNGILWFKAIEKMYSSQQLTLLYNRMNHEITIQILYDDVLQMRIGNLTKKIISGKPSKAPLLYKDINNKKILIPPLVFPFRRAIMWVAQSAYKVALDSPSSHICANLSNPSDEEWFKTFESLTDESIGFLDSAFLTNVSNFDDEDINSEEGEEDDDYEDDDDNSDDE